MSHRFEGRSLEEALQSAAETLGVERWQLTYHVLLEKRGFLGGVKRVVLEADINTTAPTPPPTSPAESSGSAPPRRGGRDARPGGGGGTAGGAAFSFTSTSMTMRFIPPRKPRFSSRT